MAFGLSGALAGLSAVYPGYREGMMEEYKLDDARRAALGRVAMGNALQMLSGQQQGSGGFTPLPQTGQPPMPGAGPQRPGMPMGQPAGPISPPGPARGAPPGLTPGGPGGMPGLPMQGGPQLPGGQQPLDWRQLVAAVRQANPNIPPDVMAEAVNQFLPMMTQQSQMEWRNISLQLREQALQQRQEQFMLAERGRNERASEAADTRRDVATIGAESREKVAGQRLEEQDLARKGRERLAEKRLEQQQQQFETRESRLQESLKFREDSTYQRLEQQKEQALQRAQQAQGKQGLAEVRAIIDAQDKHVRTRIQAYSAANNLSKQERNKLLDQADMDYNEQIAKLKQQFGGSAPTTSMPPAAGKVPDRLPAAGSGAPSEPVASPAQGGAPAGGLLDEAREAIKQGAPRDAVIQRLKERGVDPTGL